MPDDTPMATLESIAAQLTTVVAKVDTMATRLDAMDARFDTVAKRLEAGDARLDGLDAKIDTSAAETRAQLGVKIEAVEEHVTRVYDAVIALRDPLT